MSKVLVVCYSTYGHIDNMARAIAEGAHPVAGTEVTVKRFAELMDAEILARIGGESRPLAPGRGPGGTRRLRRHPLNSPRRGSRGRTWRSSPPERSALKFHQIRDATVVIEAAGQRILPDPMLGPDGSLTPVFVHPSNFSPPIARIFTIAGAGVGGICAALAAARTGAKTLLVEKTHTIGVSGFHSPVSPICKFHSADHRPINLGIHHELFPAACLHSTRDNRPSALRLTYDGAELLAAKDNRRSNRQRSMIRAGFYRP